MIIMYMTDFPIYDLKVALLVTIFYAFYRLLLSRDTWHRMNRVVLLGSAVLSFVLPLCIITTHVVETVEPLPALPPALPSVGEVKDVIVQQEHDAEWWTRLLSVIASWVVLIGMGVMLVRAVVGGVLLSRFVCRLEKHREEDGVIVAVGDEDVKPFSWMNTIVVSRKDYEEHEATLFAHEKAHIRFRHSLDLLLMEGLLILQWFNPVMWLLRNELRAVHEYEADEAVLSSGLDANRYLSLLMQKATVTGGFMLANTLSDRKGLLQRFRMLARPRSSGWVLMKVLYVGGVVLVSLYASARTVVDYQYAIPEKTDADTILFVLNGRKLAQERVEEIPTDSIKAVDVIRNKELLHDLYNDSSLTGAVLFRTEVEEPQEEDEDDVLFFETEEPAEFVGGEEAKMQYLSRHFRYPRDAVEYGVQGNVTVSFIVQKDGSITDVKAFEVSHTNSDADLVVRTYGEAPSPQQMAEDMPDALHSLMASAEETVREMPRWKPARQRGRVVRSRQVVTVKYKLE